MTHTTHPQGDVGEHSREVYDFSALKKKSFVARITLPLISAEHKTKITEHCILKAFRKSMEEEENDANEYHPAWKAPPVRRTFRLDEFFSLFHCHYRRAAPLLFHKLRNDVYKIDEESYQKEFTQPLELVSGLGFSGSIFFYTHDKSYIVKSIGRRFEYIFLYEDLMNPLAEYMEKNRNTLLSEITDVLYSFNHRLGGYLGFSPSHFVVMSNVMKNLDKDKGCRKWDLKPQNFFEPTRDLVPDPMKTEAAKSGLADELDEEILLTRKQKDDLMSILEKDTEFLMRMETIDYSLLLGRFPIDYFGEIPQPETFFSGVKSADGKWVYKMCVLDFLWNVKQLHPKIIQVAGAALPEQTVTTQPNRYRKEFLKMMDEYITVHDE